MKDTLVAAVSVVSVVCIPVAVGSFVQANVEEQRRWAVEEKRLEAERAKQRRGEFAMRYVEAHLRDAYCKRNPSGCYPFE